MKKRIFGKKLKRDINERKALFKGLMSSLVLSEKIKTTESKAKAIRADVEKLITTAKKGKSGVKKILEQKLSSEAVEKVIKDIAPRFSQRQGGYTRILRMGERLGDNASMVIMEWTEAAVILPENKLEDKKPAKSEKDQKLAKKPVKKTKVKKDTAKTKK